MDESSPRFQSTENASLRHMQQFTGSGQKPRQTDDDFSFSSNRSQKNPQCLLLQITKPPIRSQYSTSSPNSPSSSVSKYGDSHSPTDTSTSKLSSPNPPYNTNPRTSWDTKRCPQNCTEHTYPRETIPTLLHVCREARAEGQKIYTHFKSGIFESGFVNLDIDTLVNAQCHHKHTFYDGMVPFHGDWNASESVISLLAEDEKQTRTIKSLAVCVCEILPGNITKSRNFDDAVNTLIKYKGLEELSFLQIVELPFLEQLLNGRFGPWKVDVLEHISPDGLPYEKPRGQWPEVRRYMEKSFHLEMALKSHPAVQESGWKVPKIRHALFNQGQLCWLAEWSQKGRDVLLKNKKEGLISWY